MQPQTYSPRPGRIALLHGSIAGVILGLIQSIILFIAQPLLTPNNGATPGQSGIEFLFLVSPLIWVIGFLIIGTLSAKQTGATSMGTLSGLFAGLFGGIITAIAQIAVSTFGRSTFVSGSADITVTMFGETIISFYIVLIAVGSGAGFGVLGGLIGHTISSVRYQPPMPFPNVAYPAPYMQPARPANPPFPAPQGLLVPPHPPFPTAQAPSMPAASAPRPGAQASQTPAAEIVYSPPPPQAQE